MRAAVLTVVLVVAGVLAAGVVFRTSEIPRLDVRPPAVQPGPPIR